MHIPMYPGHVHALSDVDRCAWLARCEYGDMHSDVRRHACRHVCGHVCMQVCEDAYRHVCRHVYRRMAPQDENLVWDVLEVFVRAQEDMSISFSIHASILTSR